MEVTHKVKYMVTHVLKHLSRHRAQPHPTSVPPLFVGVQGPQGCGKSFLTNLLRQDLISSPHSLSVVVLSIDDLYLPHIQLTALAQAHPNNPLLRGRGQPGTHDIGLGSIILNQLKHINDAQSTGTQVRLPVFDKSLFGGEGDRVEGSGEIVRNPVDVVILEGWCLGFSSISKEEIDQRWTLPVQGLGVDFFKLRGIRKEDIIDVNERLKQYLHWWSFFDTFIQV